MRSYSAAFLIVFSAVLTTTVFLSGCVQPPAETVVTEQEATEEWRPDGVVGEREYARNMTLYGARTQGHSGGNLELSWKNDDENFYMALKGRTDGWMSIGFEPSEWMKDADVILGFVEEGETRVLDQYSTSNYGPHVPDETLGGRDDVLEYGGKEYGDAEDGGYTVIEFKRRMDTGDEFDEAFSPGQTVSIIWGMASSDATDVKHDVAHGEGVLKLEAGPAPARGETADLTAGERQGILFIREEEKAARDVYLDLYDQWGLPVFQNVAGSEQNHMDTVKVLIDRYGLEDPVKEGRGEFTNRSLEALYIEQTNAGMRSLVDALGAGATVEEINILDLESQIAGTNKDDLKVVYEGLLAGSKKHLRSFTRTMAGHGSDYAPKYLSPEEYDRIAKI